MRFLGAFAATLPLLLASAYPSAAVAGSADLHWTAPGNDSLTGRAALYDLRYSLQPITGLNFGLATRVLGVPPPSPAGTLESFVATGLKAGLTHYFAIKTADAAGNWSGLSNIATKVAMGPVDVAPGGQLALSFSPPWPNPARGSASFAASLPDPAVIDVVVFDVMGRRLRVLASGPRPSGAFRLVWDLRDERGARVMPGVYRVRAQLGDAVLTRGLVVLG